MKKYVPITDQRGAAKRTAKLAETFAALKDEIEELCPNSRERAVAITHLETAELWAGKSLAVSIKDASPETVDKPEEAHNAQADTPTKTGVADPGDAKESSGATVKDGRKK